MIRKAVIIALIITGLYLIFGNLINAWHVAAFFETSNMPDWGPSPMTWAAAQLALYFAMGYLIFRMMIIHKLMIRPTLLWFLLTALMWEFFKYSLFHQSFPYLSFFVLLLFDIMFILFNLFLFREDGRLGVVALPMTFFYLLVATPWYYQFLELNVIVVQQ
jgi:hypothetical protein